jgi:hypothetical protein
MTGDIMHLVGNKETEKLDSSGFRQCLIVSKDTIIVVNFNQVKGKICSENLKKINYTEVTSSKYRSYLLHAKRNKNLWYQ